eukprot:scaffold5917_cov146-Isochrysis_galbana.AAC.1
MRQSLCSRNARARGAGTRKDAFDRPGMRTAVSAYSRNSELAPGNDPAPGRTAFHNRMAFLSPDGDGPPACLQPRCAVSR